MKGTAMIKDIKDRIIECRVKILQEESTMESLLTQLAVTISTELNIKVGDVIDDGGRAFLEVAGFEATVNADGKHCVRAICHILRKDFEIDQRQSSIRSSCLDKDVIVMYRGNYAMPFKRDIAVRYLQDGFKIYKLGNSSSYFGEEGVKLLKQQKDSKDYILNIKY